MSTQDELIDIVAPTGRILIKPLEVENKTSGGVILAGASDPDNLCRLGLIINNSILVDGKPNDLYQEGNKVYYGKFAGAAINHNGEKIVSLTENEISAITV